MATVVESVTTAAEWIRMFFKLIPPLISANTFSTASKSQTSSWRSWHCGEWHRM